MRIGRFRFTSLTAVWVSFCDSIGGFDSVSPDEVSDFPKLSMTGFSSFASWEVDSEISVISMSFFGSELIKIAFEGAGRVRFRSETDDAICKCDVQS